MTVKQAVLALTVYSLMSMYIAAPQSECNNAEEKTILSLATFPIVCFVCKDCCVLSYYCKLVVQCAPAQPV